MKGRFSTSLERGMLLQCLVSFQVFAQKGHLHSSSLMHEFIYLILKKLDMCMPTYESTLGKNLEKSPDCQLQLTSLKDNPVTF